MLNMQFCSYQHAKTPPDIVKNYKSVRVWAGTSGLNHTGFKVNRGDYVTILAKGSINLWPTRGKEYEYGPKALLLFQLGIKISSERI